jgi:hypothetical protein
LLPKILFSLSLASWTNKQFKIFYLKCENSSIFPSRKGGKATLDFSIFPSRKGAKVTLDFSTFAFFVARKTGMREPQSQVP